MKPELPPQSSPDPQILARAQARLQHGGEGALYVLLRRRHIR